MTRKPLDRTRSIQEIRDADKRNAAAPKWLGYQTAVDLEGWQGLVMDSPLATIAAVLCLPGLQLPYVYEASDHNTRFTLENVPSKLLILAMRALREEYVDPDKLAEAKKLKAVIAKAQADLKALEQYLPGELLR